MIPKIIHYCWYGPNEMSDDSVRYIEGWKEFHPDFEFRCWNEDNSPLHPIVQENIENGLYAFASDYTRLWALKKFGGIYLDTDFELIKPMYSLLENRCFVAFQYAEMGEYAVTNALMGSIKEDPFISACLELLEQEGHSKQKPLISPRLTTRVLMNHGLKRYGTQIINGVAILKREVFYPVSYYEHLKGAKPLITAYTMAIHHFHGTWLENIENKPRAHFLQKVFSLLRRRLLRFFNVKAASI